jgi:hypothetical protein
LYLQRSTDQKRVTEECRSSTAAKILLLCLRLLLFLLLQLLLLLILLPLHRERNPKALSMTPFGDTKFHPGVSSKKTQKENQ